MFAILQCCWGLFIWPIAIGYWLFYAKNRTFYRTIEDSSKETLEEAFSGEEDGWFNSSFLVGLLFFTWVFSIPLFSTALALSHYVFSTIVMCCSSLVTVVGGALLFLTLTKTSHPVPNVPIPNNNEFVKYTIKITEDSKWNAELASNFVQQIAQLSTWVELQIEANHEEIVWHLIDYWITPVWIIERIIYSMYPTAKVTYVENKPEEFTNGKVVYRAITNYRLSNVFVGSLKFAEAMEKNDPLKMISQSMAGLEEGESIRYVVLIAGLASDAYSRGEAYVTQSTIHPLQAFSTFGIGDAIRKHLYSANRAKRFEHRDQIEFENKLRQVLYNVALLVEVDSPEMYRVLVLQTAIQSQLGLFSNAPYNALELVNEQHVPIAITETNYQSEGYKNRWLKAKRLILESREIAALWHLPYQEMKASRITKLKNRVNVPEFIARQKSGLILGTGYQDLAQEVTVRLPYRDRSTHMSIIGRTGTGKSNLLHHLIHQDIANGHGVAVLDPHGDLIQRILEVSIPDWREKSVILLDLADRNSPPPLNPLRRRGQQSLLGIISIIERLFTDTEERARLSQTLRATIQLLEYEAQPTLRDAARILLDDVYRGQLLEKCDNPEVRDYWNFQYNNQRLGFRGQIAEPIISRIRPFFGNPYLYPVICHPEAIDFEAAVREKKIILISLDIDETDVPMTERDLIGSMLTSRLQAAGMKRRNQADENIFYLYIDELQRFSTSSLDTIFSESRKYGVSLTVAHQYLDQLEDSLLQSILGNVGTTVVFRSNPLDTSKLALHMQPEFTRADLVGLDRFQAAVKLQHHNQTQPAFTLYPEKPLGPEKGSEAAENARNRAQALREQAKPKMKRDAVLAWLKQHYAEVDKPSSISPANPETFVES